MKNREQRRFTTSELREFDGKEGRPAYMAFKGKVYDVTRSSLWTDGIHRGRHSAGDDLTQSMVNAPHDEGVLMKFQVVGELSQEESFRRKITQRLEGLHLHPILVHFSITCSILVPLFTILYVFTGEVALEMASYYLLIVGCLSALAAGLSGLFSWKVTYEGMMTKILVRKIIFTVLLIVFTTVCLGWRTISPDVLIARTNLSYIYSALIVSLVPIGSILGYYGGKIVYP